DKLRKAEGFVLDLPEQGEVTHPVLLTFAVAVHDRRRRGNAEVVGLPDDTHPFFGRDLLRADLLPDRIHQDLCRRPAHRVEPGGLHLREHLFCGHAALPGRIRDFHGVARVQVNARRRLADPAVDVEIRLRGKYRVQAADRADLCYPPGLREPRLLFDDRLVVEIDSLIARLLRETAETAGIDADVGHVDVLVAD